VLSELGCGVRDDGSHAGDNGRDSDDSGIGVALPGESWEYTECGWINAL
jgi:hypothetical protein